MWQERTPPPPEALLEHAQQADALLTTITEKVDGELFDAAPSVRAVANLAVGTDNIDLDAAKERGIPVGNTPDVLTDATADIAFALLLGVARRLAEGEREVREGRWAPWHPSHLLGGDLADMTLGIVGWGRIGQAMARRGEGFGMRIVHSSRSSGVPLDELLEQADYVSLHTPLTPETRHLMGAAQFARMKHDRVLHQHLARRDGRPGRAARGAGRRRDRRRGARRDRPRAAAGRRPDPLRAEPAGGPARRLRHRPHPLAYGRPRGRQPPRRAERQGDAAPGRMTRVAAVDIGTNSTRLLIAEGTRELARESIVTRLGEGVDRTGRLGEAPQQRVLDVLARFRERIGDAAGAAVMTSAVRDASNGAAFAERVRGRARLPRADPQRRRGGPADVRGRDLAA